MAKENYLECMKRTAREAMDEPRVKKYMASVFKPGAELPLDSIIEKLEQHSRDYAQDWNDVAAKHEDSGLYRKIAEFIGAREGVYVDIGCGAGNLLCALPSSLRLIGADINPYILQIAEENLAKAGKKAERHSGIRMGFLPTHGLVVRPEPLMDELDLSKVQLISDDNRDMGNTIRTLYNHGIKADGAFYTLAGGHSVQRAGEMITAIRYMQTGKDPGEIKDLKDILGPILRNIPFIVRRGGAVYLAIRGAAMNENMQVQGMSIQDYINEYNHKNLEVTRESSIPIMNEGQENGISLSVHGDPKQPIPKKFKKIAENLPYQLNLSEVRVK